MIHPTARISEHAFVDPSAEVGEHSVVWHFAVILANVKIGKHCSVGSGTEIGSGSEIGDRSRISAHVFLPSNSIIGQRCFCGPGSVFTDDRHPRAGNVAYQAEPPVLESGCSVGAGACVLPGIRIGVGAMVGAGSIVTRDVPAHSHVRGEPARVKDYSQVVEKHHRNIYAPGVGEISAAEMDEYQYRTQHWNGGR